MATKHRRGICSLLLALAPRLCADEPAPALTDSRELDSFLAPIFRDQMAALEIPGAAIVVVKDGQILFSQGYGLADIERSQPVSPEHTVFRVASLSKPFTATAVMQLVEQGKLSLDDDVNAHLSQFEIPPIDGQRARIGELLTHTAGFDDWSIDSAARSVELRMPLGDYLAQRMPPRLYAPGTLIRYSNHGSVLAGHLVEAASGQGFADYMDAQVLQPLGMRDSSFLLPPAMAAKLATGYSHGPAGPRPAPYMHYHGLPAIGLSSTAHDLSRFLIAQLQGGIHDGARILEESSVQAMQRQQFSYHPQLPGVTYGFFEQTENGLRLLQHSGHVQGFASQLFLLPEQQLGIVILCNSDRVDIYPQLFRRVIRELVDRYYPAAARAVLQPPINAPNLDHAGVYHGNAYSHTSIEKVGLLFAQTRIEQRDDGTLLLQVPFEAPSEWQPVEPDLFQQIGDPERHLAFKRDERGQVTHLFGLGGFGTINTYERLPWHADARSQRNLLLAIVLLFLSSALWPIGWLIQRWRNAQPAVARIRRARRLAIVVCALNLAFLLGFANLLADPWKLGYGISAAAKLLFVLPLISVAFTPLLVIRTAGLWRDLQPSRIAHTHLSMLSLAACGFAAILGYWNLLGFNW